MPLSSQAPVSVEDTSTYSVHPAFLSLSKHRTQSDPFTSSVNRNEAPEDPPNDSPPPSYSAALREGPSQSPAADGYFRAYKSKTPERSCPPTAWPDPQQSAALLQHLGRPILTNLSNPPSGRHGKQSAAGVPQMSSCQHTASQVLQHLYNVRKLLIPYHQSLASYHARCIERYARQAAANLWESQNAGAYQTPSIYPQSIWGPQDDSDPCPRSTFWDKAVSTSSSYAPDPKVCTERLIGAVKDCFTPNRFQLPQAAKLFATCSIARPNPLSLQSPSLRQDCKPCSRLHIFLRKRRPSQKGPLPK